MDKMDKSIFWRLTAKGFQIMAGLSMFTVLALGLMTSTAHGQLNINVLANLNKPAQLAGFETGGPANLAEQIGLYINVLLGFLGIIALVLVIYAGFLWMTAAGNEEKVTTAKNILKQAIIGIIIISLAFAITQFVIQSITKR